MVWLSVMHVQVAITRLWFHKPRALPVQSGTTVVLYPQLARCVLMVSTVVPARLCATTALAATTGWPMARAQRSVEQGSSASKGQQIVPTVLWVSTRHRLECTRASCASRASTLQQRVPIQTLVVSRARKASTRRLQGKASARAVVRVRSVLLAILRALCVSAVPLGSTVVRRPPLASRALQGGT